MSPDACGFAGQPVAQPVRLRIARSDAAAQATFTVERFASMTILDALLSVQRDLDPSIGFRFSCRVAMCGTCTLRVNGRAVLACQTLVPGGTEELEIAPLAGLPLVRDLVVDMAPFWDQWARITPYLKPRETLIEPAQVAPDSDERGAIDEALDCIACGACYSSCGISGHQKSFLGPAALNRAMVLISDSRDAAGAERRALVDDADGSSRCHLMYGCTGVCPKGLNPARAIRRLRTGRVEDR